MSKHGVGYNYCLQTVVAIGLLSTPAEASRDASSRPPAAAELVVPADFIITAMVNGHALRLRVDADTGGSRILNASTAQALSLRGSGIQGLVRVGTTELIARSRSVATTVADEPTARIRWHWFERDIAADADGRISPVTLPYARVVFRHRESNNRDVTETLPLEGERTYGMGGGEGQLTVADNPIAIGMAFDRPETIVSASVGALLATTHGGHLIGETLMRPVRYGVERPLRLMRLDTPLRIASLTVNAVYVRMAEPGVSELLQADMPIDPMEILVTGERQRRRPKLVISLGAADLAQCPVIMFDNQAHLLSLTCRQDNPTVIRSGQ